MGRVALMERLLTYPAIQEAGITMDHIWPNFALDISPRTDGLFMVLRWGANLAAFGNRSGKRSLTVWVYQPRQMGTDYTAIDLMIGHVIECLIDTVHFEGSDGSVLSCADFNGLSADLVDEGYDTIARNADFSVLCREP